MFRIVEGEQNQAVIQEFAAWFVAEGYQADPIVVVSDDWILDGHHRYLAAVNTNVEPTVSRIDAETYSNLSEQGYDGMEIAAIAHLLSGNDEAALNLDRQFAGADVYDRAASALDR